MRSIIATLSASGLLMAVPVAAQTARDANSTREAYGARLAPESSETDFSTVRVNKRLDTRIASRISTRIERYRVGATADPAVAFSAARDQLTKQVTPVQPAPQSLTENQVERLRLLIAQAVTDMAGFPARPARPVLFLFDEFAALGRLEPVERAMGLMVSYGLQFQPILQDMHQLRATYGERADTFMSNAGVVRAFGVNDHATANMLSKTIGDTTIEYTTF